MLVLASLLSLNKPERGSILWSMEQLPEPMSGIALGRSRRNPFISCEHLKSTGNTLLEMGGTKGWFVLTDAS